MSFSKLSMIFIVVFMSLFLPFAVYTHFDALTTQVSEETREDLTNASFDAMQAVTLIDGKAFSTTAQRSEALDTFYRSLAASYGFVADGGEHETVLTSRIPFVALIDTDGVYVTTSKEYRSWGADNAQTYKTTPITTYSESYLINSHQYIVQFKLDNTAVIYKDGEKIGDGTYKELVKHLDHSVVTDFNSVSKILTSKKAFLEEKQIVITNVVSRAVENYINEYIASNNTKLNSSKTGYNTHGTSYRVVIPLSHESDFANALSSPTIISFYQGDQIQTGDTYTMSVALAGGELGISDKYYITKEGNTYYYHSSTECSRYKRNGGHDHPSRYYSMEEAATLGAYPCPDCVH